MTRDIDWAEAIREAEQDERAAEAKLTALREERSKWMKDWNMRRDAAKQDLRDALSAKNSAAYAARTGRDPR